MNYLLTLIVIAVSGNPAALLLGKDGTYIAVFLALVLVFIKKKIAVDRRALIFPLIMGGLMLIHVLNFGTMVVTASLGFVIKIAIGILLATIVDNLPRVFVRCMAVLSCLSLVFYLPYMLGFDLSKTLSFLRVPIAAGDGYSSIVHIGIHNFHQEDARNRNCGMFWEPGAFAGYLVLALYVFVMQRTQSRFKLWEISALICALATTLSTTGYVCGFVLLLYYYYRRQTSKKLTAIGVMKAPIILVVLIAIPYAVFSELDFLGGKIESQLESTQEGVGTHQINRFGNVLYDLDFIEKRPMTGWSGTPSTRFSIDQDLQEFISGQGGGLTGFVVRFGFIGAFALYYGLYVSAVRVSSRQEDGVFLIVVVSLILVGEQFTNFPFIYSFLALHGGRKGTRKLNRQLSPLVQRHQIEKIENGK